MEKEMAPHSSILAWRIPRTEEPGRSQSMGSQRVGHDWVTKHTHNLHYAHPFPYICLHPSLGWIFPGGAAVLPMQEMQETWIFAWVRKIPWSRKWQPAPVFLLGRFMDRGAWWTIVYDFAKSWTWLSMHTHTIVSV